MKKKIRIPKWIIYGIPIIFLVALEFTSVYRTTDNVIKDMVYSSTGRLDPRVSLVGIDEETLSAYGSMEEWGRDKLADIINVLMEDPANAPKIIAVDIGVYSHKDPEVDQKLVDAVRNAGNVIFVSAVSFGNVVKVEGNNYTASLEVLNIEEPFDELKDAALAVGHSNIFLDEDGYARHALASVEKDGYKVDSFSATIAEHYLGSIDPRFKQLNSRFYIEYTGLAGDYYGALGSGLSFKRVLEKEIPAAVFKNGIVFIGAYASGMQDRYYTSTSKSQLMNGVEIQANTTVQTLNGRYFREITTTGRLMLVILFGAISGLILYLVDYRKGMVLAFLVATAYVVFGIVLYHSFCVLLPILSPVLVMILPCIIRTVIEYLNLYQERQRLVSNFSRYLPQSVAEKVAEKATEGQEENAFPGERRDIAVMFVDIRGFTPMAESMEPEQIAHMINSFLSVTTASVFKYGGTIDKFIGDCTMALFNAPLEQEDYEFRAICSALDIQKQIGNIPVDPDDFTKVVRVGIGIDCGSAMVGNVGTRFRMDYTAIGNVVNVASRMEGMAGPGEILVSAGVYQATCDRVDFAHRGTVLLKGKTVPTDVYRVIGLKG